MVVMMQWQMMLLVTVHFVFTGLQSIAPNGLIAQI
jgi:hypothetical protein